MKTGERKYFPNSIKRERERERERENCICLSVCLSVCLSSCLSVCLCGDMCGQVGEWVCAQGMVMRCAFFHTHTSQRGAVYIRAHITQPRLKLHPRRSIHNGFYCTPFPLAWSFWCLGILPGHVRPLGWKPYPTNDQMWTCSAVKWSFLSCGLLHTLILPTAAAGYHGRRNHGLRLLRRSSR